MRYTFLIAIFCLAFFSCKKDKYTTVPQIKFIKFNPNTFTRGVTSDATMPILSFNITDSQGDLGDTAFIYIKNLRTNNFDSIRFPNLGQAATKNFLANVSVNFKQYIRVPNYSLKDTIYYEIYVKDFAKNKSNVIKTDNPIYYLP